MSFFNDIVTDVNKLEQEFLGPDYNYVKFIRSPSDLGMSSDGSMRALKNDVAGIVNYVEILIGGGGRASKTGKPLGDRFFLKTGGQCKDYKTGKIVTRDMYIDNIPDGTIPGLSELSGMKFTEFEGFIPGIFSNLDAINPLKLFGAFMEGENPLCAEVSLPTIDENNNKSTQSGFIPISELNDMGFSSPEMKKALEDSVNKEGFINLNELKYYKDNMDDSENKNENINKIVTYKHDTFSNLYIISISILLLYISYKFMKK